VQQKSCVWFVKKRVSTSQMLIPGETFTESYAAVPDSVPDARNALTEFARDAGADSERLEAVRLAASEAVTNAVMHAYDSGQQGTVQVSASYVENELWLLIADTGNGLRPRSNSPGLGLGLALIAQLADEFQIISRGSGGTELRLRFRLATPKRRSEEPRRSSGRHDRGSVSTALSPA
jgi:stage II sporulation protein AB (anti-sigma F factor)